MFFLLYLNRLFSYLVSYAIRTYTWHKHHIYVEIQALQISLLAGRVFVSGVRYHGKNEAFHIQQGYFTWCYWLRNVRNLGQLNDRLQDTEGQETSTKALPCRFAAHLVGIEWFVYNRTPIYDSMLEGLLRNSPPQTGPSSLEIHDTSSIRRRATRLSDEAGADEAYSSQGNTSSANLQNPIDAQTSHGAGSDNEKPPTTDESEIPLLLRVFPIHLEVNKAAMVMGNEHTKAVLVVKADDLSGDIDAISTDTPDPYRQVFNLRFKHPVVEMRQNADYREEQTARATRERRAAQTTEPITKKPFFSWLFGGCVSSFQNMMPRWKYSMEPATPSAHTPIDTATSQPAGASQWQGLSRYLDDQAQDDKARWAHVEYAAEPVIVDSPSATMCIYWDSPTKVPELPDPALRSKEDPYATNINGEIPPAWGINMTIKGGVVNYGPWADRCRAELQNVFFPTLCKNAIPTPAIRPGEYRVATQFRLYIQLDDNVTVRILTREDSKNWKWKGKAPMPTDAPKRRRRDKKDAKPEAIPAQTRQPGWLEFKVSPNSTINYSMDMVAGTKGYSTTVDVDFPGTEMSSSVNHQILLRSGPFKVSCDMGSPLQWNALRAWNFGISSDDIELFLLRDHIFLITDLVEDWGSGPLTEYLVFTPFKYLISLDFRRFKLYLNVNDANVIDNAISTNENMFLVLGSSALAASLTIPIDQFRPPKNAIPFEVRLDPLMISLQLPPWNTQAAFMPSKEIGQAESLVACGKYEYNATTSVANTDTLVLDISIQSLVVKLFGSVLRYGLKLKDNYFGDDLHFRTVQEYQDMLQLREYNPSAETANRAPYKKSNDMDVVMAVKLDDTKIFVPGNLYSAERNIHVEMASITADARFTNYYMDLELIISPISLALGAFQQESDISTVSSTTTQMFIDGVRVFGNRLFGLPPSEPTYMCNWDLGVGAVTGECNAEFLAALALGGQALSFTFDDEENALVSFSSIVYYDVTFLRLHVDAVKLWVHVDEAAFLLSTGRIDVNYNDWARSHYSKKATISLPDIQISCINTEDSCSSRAKHFGCSSNGTSRANQTFVPAEADVMVKTHVQLTMIGRKFKFTEERKKQQELIRREDQRTQRIPFLLFPEYASDYMPEAVDPPAQDIPQVPHPINGEFLGDDQASSIRTGSSARSHGSQRTQRSRIIPKTGGGSTLRRQSSFLSFSSTASSSKSVLRPSDSSGSRSRSQISHSQPQSRPQPQSRRGERWRDAARRSSTYSEMTESIHDAQSSAVFSSQYFTPSFTLENVVPQSRDALALAIAEEQADYGDFMIADFPLEDIDPNSLSEDHTYTGFVVEFPRGISGFFTPASVQHTTKLLSALQPSSPDDILDSLHLSSMEDILKFKKEADIRGSILDVMVCLPSAHFRFLNSSSLDSPDPLLEEQDQYDVQLSKLAVVMRNTESWGDAFKAETRNDRTSFRASFGSMTFSASERLNGGAEPQAAVQAHIDGATFSMGSRDVTSIDTDIGNITCNMSSSKLQYLASLIHRTDVLVKSIGTTVEEVVSSHKNRVQFFVQQLLAQGQRIPDPPFIVRPSAVLRSVPGHLRVHDSWKMVQRLRQIWSKMDSLARDELLTACLEPHPMPPDDVQKQIIAMFTKWRGWDLGPLSDSVLIRRIFDRLEKDSVNAANSRATRGHSSTLPPASSSPSIDKNPPLLMTCHLGEIELVLDPGPKQNRAALMGLTAKVKSNDLRNLPPDNFDIGNLDEPSTTVINLHCREAAVKINWELCELVDDVLELYNRTAANSASSLAANGSVNPASPKGKPVSKKGIHPASTPKHLPEPRLHIVVAFGKSSLDLDTINLHSTMLCSGINGSILVDNHSGGAKTLNVILSSHAVTSSLFSHSLKLGMFQLQEPSLFISHEERETANMISHVVKCAPSSKSMSLIVKQDPLALFEVADLLIKDEFARLYKIKTSTMAKFAKTPTASPKAAASLKIIDQLSSIKINVAMFLNNYNVTIPLCQNLTYNIQGVVARAAVATNFGKELIFDFDIKENSHSFGVGSGLNVHEVSLLQIPPMNGRVLSVIGPTEHTISVATSLEMVQLDASAVYSLLMLPNKAQLTAEIEDMQVMAQALKRHFNDIVDPDQIGSPLSGPASKPSTVVSVEPTATLLVYSAHVSLAGLHVFGKTSLVSDPDPLAYVSFSLEKVHVEVTNQAGPGQPIFDSPQINLNLSHIGFDMRKGHEAAMRSCGSLVFSALLSMSLSGLGPAPEPGSSTGHDQCERWFSFQTNGLEIMLSPETVSTAIDIMGHMGDKMKDLDTTRERHYLRKLRHSKPRISINNTEDESSDTDLFDSVLDSFVYHFQIRDITLCWLVSGAMEESVGQEDLVLTVELIELSTRKSKSACLEIQNMQLQMDPVDEVKTSVRSHHSALLPEIIFKVASFSSGRSRKLAFQAVGKSVDVRLTSGFIIPATHLQDSLTRSASNIQKATENWSHPAPVDSISSPSTPTGLSSNTVEQPPGLSRKRVESLLIHADFAGAILHLSGRRSPPVPSLAAFSNDKPTSAPYCRTTSAGKYGQFKTDESNISATLHSPGLAWRSEYRDNGTDKPSLNGEIKVEGSSNTLHPTVVPLIMDMSSSFKEVVSEQKQRDDKKERQHEKAQTEKKKRSRTSETTSSWLGTVVTTDKKDNNKDSNSNNTAEDDNSMLGANPSNVFGKLNINIGLRITKQEFSLSCQPIARVAATGSFDSIYMAINTVHSHELGSFLTLTTSCSNLQASVQHVYSRDSTASFAVDSIVLSLMNSKHFSGTAGVSALLKVSPMQVAINARQMQDFLLFGEIWYPKEMRGNRDDGGGAVPMQQASVPTTDSTPIPVPVPALHGTTKDASQSNPDSPSTPSSPIEPTMAAPNGHFVQMYQQVSATAAFPWTATISIESLNVDLDMGQAVGKSVFVIRNFWVSSKKTSNWEQNLCLGFERIGIDSTGRMSGFVALHDFKLRTSIQWPDREQIVSLTPLIQSSLSFDQFRLKASWDYQAFLVADITSLDFLMYNRRGPNGDRLVAILDGEAVQAFGTPSSVAQGASLYRAILKFIQERKASFELSLQEIEKFTKRRSLSNALTVAAAAAAASSPNEESPANLLSTQGTQAESDGTMSKAPISLDTDVIVTLKAVNLGIFPSSFTDHQVFKIEALNAHARFAANFDEQRLHSLLDLTLGQLRVGLASVNSDPPKNSSDLSVKEVVQRSTGARGGTILKVPRVHAAMETWQSPQTNKIDYIFSSAFEGKVEVGWNYSRISFIRSMWASHIQSVQDTWGKTLPLANSIKVTGVPDVTTATITATVPTKSEADEAEQKRKITAEVSVPQSKYEYHALREPIIQTPQLKDMGEATPPLEWIGLHRDRLPNLTHQIVIVTLLELAGEVEDAYSRILGSSDRAWTLR
ncbi:fermentation associated protein [Ceratocystis lukuohia]|uniref:Fermentation associated protein n=1 Tax=Ceratocystis lukuohia TaxID=2019550 RepID=A0ABR4MQ99_9PEZI